MADWALIEMTLETWARAITGLDVVWRGRPRAPSFSDAGYVVLSLDSVATVGNDQLTTNYITGAPAGQEIVTVQEGARTFTFGMQIRTYMQSVGHDARHYACLIRDRVCLPIVTGEALDAAGIAFARILGDTALVNDEHDGRMMSVHQMDLRMNAVAVTSDTPIGYIDTADEAEAQIPPGNTVAIVDLEV